jgi:hypothetical protein
MNALDTVIASLADSRLTLGGLLKRLQVQARLGPLVREALVLVQITERHEPVLDPAIRQAIQQELFEKWLADGTKEATLDLAIVGTAG